MNLKNILDNKIYLGRISEIKANNKCVINTINPHSYIIAKEDKLFDDALKNSNILLPDGTGIVFAAKLLIGKKVQKIAGADIHKHLLEKADVNHKRVFYLGASVSTLHLIKKRIVKEHPNIKVAFHSPPYKNSFSEKDTEKMIVAINEFRPDILFVGMTAPKQEKWVYLNKEKINAKVIASIGAVFDFYAGTIERPSDLWINLGLEWLPRFLKEPRRLWRRNMISTPLFLLEILKEKLK